MKSDFSKYCGGWSEEEFCAFESAVADCERIEPSTALETGARLVSYDRHFDSVGGLIRLAP